jgi:hypothetical protein
MVFLANEVLLSQISTRPHAEAKSNEVHGFIGVSACTGQSESALGLKKRRVESSCAGRHARRPKKVWNF